MDVRDCSVRIATNYGLEGRGSNLGSGKILLFSTACRPALGLNQPRGVKRPGGEADYSHPSRDEIKITHNSPWSSA
jgi:hypothetical protein